MEEDELARLKAAEVLRGYGIHLLAALAFGRGDAAIGFAAALMRLVINDLAGPARKRGLRFLGYHLHPDQIFGGLPLSSFAAVSVGQALRA